MADTLSSVAQALRILDLLRAHDRLGVTEIADELGVGTSSVHRLLATLAEAHYVRQVSPGRKYRLGPVMQESVEGAAVDHCVEVALPLMEQLRDDSGETVHLVVLQRTNVKFVAAVESLQTMRVTNRAGRLLPANATAAGKLLLATRPPEEIDVLFSQGLSGATPETITSLKQLHAALEETRAHGYGRNYSEAELGVAALAVPIHRPQGRILCALTLTGPDSRFNPRHEPGVSDRELALLEVLRATASAIEENLEF